MPGSQGRGSLLALWQYAVDIGIYFYSFSETILEMYLLFKVVENLGFFFSLKMAIRQLEKLLHY